MRVTDLSLWYSHGIVSHDWLSLKQRLEFNLGPNKGKEKRITHPTQNLYEILATSNSRKDLFKVRTGGLVGHGASCSLQKNVSWIPGVSLVYGFSKLRIRQLRERKCYFVLCMRLRAWWRRMEVFMSEGGVPPIGQNRWPWYHIPPMRLRYREQSKGLMHPSPRRE